MSVRFRQTVLGTNILFSIKWSTLSLLLHHECQLDLCVKVKLEDLFMSKMCLELDTTLIPLFLIPEHDTLRFMCYSIMFHDTLHIHF